MSVLSLAAFATPAAAETIGLVFTDLRYALHQTPEQTECPAGLQKGEALQFKATPGFMEHLKKFGGSFENRGPGGQLPQYDPTKITDPLPWSELQTKTGYGINLDGTTDGRATAKTCKHEKFTNPEGQPIDNQMARALGCAQGWRKTGFMAEFYSNEVSTSPVNRNLVEIAGVDDEQNDPSVDVTIFKGMDRLVRAGDGNYIPYMSHRVDQRFPEYIFKGTGKIVNGELISDPIPFVRMALLQIQIPGERQVRDFTLKLKLDPNGAKGYMGGYEDIAVWFNNHSKNPGSDVGALPPAGLYRALHRYADGYPDASGNCSAISVAYEVSAVRALIVHPPKQQDRVASAPEGATRVAMSQDKTH